MTLQIGTAPQEVLNRLLALQWHTYEYEDFLIVLKHRLRKYTGIDEVMFFSEEQLVQMLEELKIVSYH